MYKGIIFDLDGTLVDSLDDLTVSLNTALAEAGLPTRNRDEVRLMIGNGMTVLVKRALEGQDVDEKETARIKAVLEAHYALHSLDKTRPYKGIDELIVFLKREGLKLGVLSNKPDDFATSIVAALFPAGPFALVRGQLPGVPTKPDPQAALEMIRGWGLAPKEVAIVGDSAVDIETGRNAGCDSLGAGWGFRGRGELEAAGATAVLESPLEIADWLATAGRTKMS
ncbi:MAG TPA: HAD family hydrolase [Rectinemataceae bacterium]|nr:HAD family hydrolase [Rectinemataceae bacterium]